MFLWVGFSVHEEGRLPPIPGWPDSPPAPPPYPQMAGHGLQLWGRVMPHAVNPGKGTRISWQLERHLLPTMHTAQLSCAPTLTVPRFRAARQPLRFAATGHCFIGSVVRHPSQFFETVQHRLQCMNQPNCSRTAHDLFLPISAHIIGTQHSTGRGLWGLWDQPDGSPVHSSHCPGPFPSNSGEARS